MKIFQNKQVNAELVNYRDCIIKGVTTAGDCSKSPTSREGIITLLLNIIMTNTTKQNQMKLDASKLTWDIDEYFKVTGIAAASAFGLAPGESPSIKIWEDPEVFGIILHSKRTGHQIICTLEEETEDFWKYQSTTFEEMIIQINKG